MGQECQYILNGTNYNNSTAAQLSGYINNFSQLSQSVQDALEDLQYNTEGAFLGNDPANSQTVSFLENNDIASAAYQIAYNTATPGNQAYESRCLIDAAEMLGLNVTIDGNYDIIDLNGTLSANDSIVVNFLQQTATNQPSAYLTTTYGEDFFNNVVTYAASQGYYVPQPGDTWSSIEGQNFNAVNLEPGMAVTVEIKTGSRHIIQYLLSPFRRHAHDAFREK